MFYLHMINKAIDAGLTAYQSTIIPAVSGVANMVWRPAFGVITTISGFRNIPIVGSATILFGLFIAAFGAAYELTFFLALAACAGLAVGKHAMFHFDMCL